MRKMNISRRQSQHACAHHPGDSAQAMGFEYCITPRLLLVHVDHDRQMLHRNEMSRSCMAGRIRLHPDPAACAIFFTSNTSFKGVLYCGLAAAPGDPIASASGSLEASGIEAGTRPVEE